MSHFTDRRESTLCILALVSIFSISGEIAVADVFISYSKKDVEQVRLLEAFLQSEGLTVWWDRELSAGEEFSDTIVRQLELARAVIVIWTENSVRSNFVYAEAANAQFHEKLVPVRSGTVGYEQLRPPFNAVHAEEFDNKNAILKAINERIDTPKSSKYRWHQFRYRALLAWGVLGSVITVFASIGAFIELANWAKALVHYWLEWLGVFWSSLFKFLDLSFPLQATGVASFALFWGSTLLAARIRVTAVGLPEFWATLSSRTSLFGLVHFCNALATRLYGLSSIYILTCCMKKEAASQLILLLGQLSQYSQYVCRLFCIISGDAASACWFCNPFL